MTNLCRRLLLQLALPDLQSAGQFGTGSTRDPTEAALQHEGLVVHWRQQRPRLPGRGTATDAAVGKRSKVGAGLLMLSASNQDGGHASCGRACCKAHQCQRGAGA